MTQRMGGGKWRQSVWNWIRCEIRTRNPPRAQTRIAKHNVTNNRLLYCSGQLWSNIHSAGSKSKRTPEVTCTSWKTQHEGEFRTLPLVNELQFLNIPQRSCVQRPLQVRPQHLHRVTVRTRPSFSSLSVSCGIRGHLEVMVCDPSTLLEYVPTSEFIVLQ